MRRELRWSPRAERDLEQIQRHSPQMARRIFGAMTGYADTGHGDVVKLTAADGAYRLRVGDWRVIFTYEDRGFVVLALRVMNRRDAYR
ncbi:MAG: type II toxin-antitoxin system RelE/ParE family toxin [Chloroflexota bacterium]